MRPFVERFVSFLTVLLAVFAMAQLASAEALPDPGSQETQVEAFQPPLPAGDADAPPPTTIAARPAHPGVGGGP